MQFSAARRTGKTYGKENRVAVVHDLFDHRASSYDTAGRKPVNTISGTDSNLSPASPTQHTTHKQAPSSSDRTSSPVSSSEHLYQPNKSESKRKAIEDKSLYDINSSEDEGSTDTSGSRGSKRRRINRPLTGARVTPFEAAPVRSELLEEPKKRLPSLARSGTKRINDAITPKVKVHKSELQVRKSPKYVPEDQKLAPQKRSTQRNTAKSRPLPSNLQDEISATTVIRNVHLLTDEQSATDPSEWLSDRSHGSATVPAPTPRKKVITPTGTDSDLSSPSQLGMTSLKLNPAGTTPKKYSPEIESDGSNLQKKSRRRLIDRLDLPSRSAEQTSEDPLSDGHSSTNTSKVTKTIKSRTRLASTEHKDRRPKLSKSGSDGPQSSQNRIIPVSKPRMTYATQRSHLSDMVDDIDMLSAPSSQKSADEILSQIPTSNIASQLDLDDEESDDQLGVNKLKSIHELRQAGANNRFDREVDALFEDIGVDNNSSKALRLQALMKLVTKLQDPSFLRHIMNVSRLQRLAMVAKQVVDSPTRILLTSAFILLAKSEEASFDNLHQIFNATTDLSLEMMSDDRSLSKICKDRKQNLSKALVRDLTEFENSAGTWKDLINGHGQLCADMLALTCLEATLRRLVRLNDSSAKLPIRIYSAILGLVPTQVRYLHDDSHDPGALAKLGRTLSIIELASIAVDEADPQIANGTYVALGASLAGILNGTEENFTFLAQGALRVVVSISNNNRRICRLLSTSEIPSAAFDIITNNFLDLSKQADTNQTLDKGRLDSVVLALGCLLNFAECDSEMRTRLSQRKPDENNPIARLVSIFNSRVSKIDEALTEEQSQVLVAFGYLSMLLCTLSLHPVIRSQVTQLLKDSSFAELCAAAEKFFSHLRTVEHMSEDDTSVNSFTARFGAILETIRTSNT